MSEPRNTITPPPPADPHVLAHAIMVWGTVGMSKKAKRRFALSLKAAAERMIAHAADYGNVYPINGGGLAIHETARAQSSAAVGRCILTALEPLLERLERAR